MLKYYPIIVAAGLTVWGVLAPLSIPHVIIFIGLLAHSLAVVALSPKPIPPTPDVNEELLKKIEARVSKLELARGLKR